MCQTSKVEVRDVLPENVKPVHYDVNLTPDLESFVFSGTVRVSLKVKEDSLEIVANQNELQVSKAKVIQAGSELVAESITLDKEKETVTFKFASPVKKDVDAVLVVEFTGIHNDKMAGFYRSGYTGEDGSKRHLVVTQFEATDCRRCFPSWDEPNLKATFDITLNVPKDRTALSNMPIVSETPVQIAGKDLVSVKFDRTPIMSTYLVAMCVGEFDYLEQVSNPKGQNPITCRVYTLKGQREMGRFGLGVCTKTLEFFSEYFDVAYPLPKMDMVAIPDFGAGAMENWGLVTYRETALLWDPKKSSAKAKERVAYVVGHELAHQWFGNLVTMDWWSELWLNEGFATFVGWLAVDHIFPEWNVFTSFVVGEFTAGVNLDSLRSSHPIEVPVKSPAEINQIFDAISYSKGASVIRMLNRYLGGNVFANGVRSYLKKFAYKNAKTTDLWASLSEASGLDVAAMMHAWTRDVGFPMLTVLKEEYSEEKKEMTLSLEQKRFLSTGDLTPEEEAKSPNWVIPIGVTTLDTKGESITVQLKEKVGTISFPYTKTADSFYKLNANTTGFYRVNYTADQLKRLSAAIAKHESSFSTQDRIGIISDAFAFARAGYGSTIGALELLNGFKHEENQVVLEEIATKLALLRQAWFKDAEAIKGLNALRRAIFSPKVKALGYDYPEGEPQVQVLKRNLVINCAASANDESVVAELQSRFKKYLAGNKDAFHPNLREPVFKTVLKHTENAESDFEAVLNIYKNAETADEKIAVLGSLGAVNDIKIARKILYEIAMNSDLVRLQDCMYPVLSVASVCPLRVEALELTWDWLTKNWDGLHEKLSGTISLLGRVLQASISANCGLEFIQTVEDWAAGKDCTSPEATAKRVAQLKDAKRPLEQSLEAVKGRTTWLLRETEVSGWLSSTSF